MLQLYEITYSSVEPSMRTYMAQQLERLLFPVFASLGASLTLVAQILDVLTPDTWIVCVMGAAGGLLGAFIRLQLKKEKHRDIKLSLVQEIAGAALWAMVGAYTLLAAIMIRIYLAWFPPAVVFFPVCFYLPTAYVSFEKAMPGILDRVWEALKVLVGKGTDLEK